MLRVLLEITVERAAAVFQAADVNGDGVLEPYEFKALVQKVAQSSGFGSAIRDVDERPWALGQPRGRLEAAIEGILYRWGGTHPVTGKECISKEQWLSYIAAVRRSLDILEFAAFDVNGDGTWSARELAAYLSALVPAARDSAEATAGRYPGLAIGPAGFAGMRRVLSRPEAFRAALCRAQGGSEELGPVSVAEWCTAVSHVVETWQPAADGTQPVLGPELATVIFHMLDADHSGKLCPTELDRILRVVSSRAQDNPRGPAAIVDWFQKKLGSGRS